MSAMQRFGKGFMFVSALLWVVAGAVVFSSPRSGDPPRVAHVINMQLASAGMPFNYDNARPVAAQDDSVVNSSVSDLSGGNPWEGPYYVSAQGSDIHATEIAPEPVKPWYVQYFGGFGAMFHNLLAVSDPASQEGSLAQGSLPVKSLPPACTISIIPNSVPYGGSATVTWTSRNADHVVFQGIGEVARSGSIPVKQLTSTRALALAVVGAQGLSSSCYTVVNVEPVISIE